MSSYLMYKRRIYWDFCGSPVVKTKFPMKGGVGSIPGRGIMIPHATQHGYIYIYIYIYIYNFFLKENILEGQRGKNVVRSLEGAGISNWKAVSELSCSLSGLSAVLSRWVTSPLGCAREMLAGSPSLLRCLLPVQRSWEQEFSATRCRL